jgi:hypothetical protein
MEGIAKLTAPERRELFAETAARMRITPAIAEKDFWVCWTLGRLFADPELARLLIFKGGTSLSKVFNLIERFSEDIDLILDWRSVAGEIDPAAERSATQQAALNKALNEKAQAFISQTLQPKIATALSPLCSCAIASDDPHALNVTYPAAFSDAYLRPQVRLEIGPLAAWMPSARFQIQPYAAQIFPTLFKKATCEVQAIRAERTFWEKATILHHEAHRPPENPQPMRYSRHYYDLAMVSAAPVKSDALADLDLLADVVAFKQRFYPRGWARYELAKPGSFRLMPSDAVSRTIERDYAAMRAMIFGPYPSFDALMATLKSLEDEINALAKISAS